MPARIFVSCGQRPGPENDFCSALRAWLTAQGFSVYVAIEIQSILDLNHDIIAGLKTSDYYLFINFAREKVRGSLFNNWRRGSVYTNQELAIALAEGIDHCLFINQRGVRKEGIHHYLVSNVPEFDGPGDLLPIVQHAIAIAGWSPTFSRHLSLARLRWGNPVIYGDHTGQRAVRTLHGDIRNSKKTQAAHGVVARMTKFGPPGALVASPDLATLKASGFIGYEHVIFPESENPFDLLSLEIDAAATITGRVFLNSSMDVHPRQPIVSLPGLYHFQFDILGQHFPKFSFATELNVVLGSSNQPQPIMVPPV